jgi:hypothetical protein
VTWVDSRVQLFALTAPDVPVYAFFKPLPALPFGKVLKVVCFSAMSLNIKEIIYTCRIKIEEHASGMPRHARGNWFSGRKEACDERLDIYFEAQSRIALHPYLRYAEL